MLDDHAKRYAFVIDKKLKFFHIKTEEHGFIFVTLKVDITPMGNKNALHYTSV